MQKVKPIIGWRAQLGSVKKRLSLLIRVWIWLLCALSHLSSLLCSFIQHQASCCFSVKEAQLSSRLRNWFMEHSIIDVHCMSAWDFKVWWYIGRHRKEEEGSFKNNKETKVSNDHSSLLAGKQKCNAFENSLKDLLTIGFSCKRWQLLVGQWKAIIRGSRIISGLFVEAVTCF